MWKTTLTLLGSIASALRLAGFAAASILNSGTEAENRRWEHLSDQSKWATFSQMRI